MWEIFTYITFLAIIGKLWNQHFRNSVMNGGCLRVKRDKYVLVTTFISPEAKLPNQ